MPKTTSAFNLSEYALVADRITLFYERYPLGRIITELVSHDRDVVFKASVYRGNDDREPAATGWAKEREGDGEINLVACVENTETSAIGRALANLGFTASRKRPSREEMEKADRARRSFTVHSKVAETAATRAPGRAQRPESAANRQPAAPQVTTEKQIAVHRDVARLLERVEGLGFPLRRSDIIRSRLSGERPLSVDECLRVEQKLRSWAIRRRQAQRS